MDYNRIYAEFIVNRGEREANLVASGDYYEKHHVIPRSLGGGDSTDNIIALTPSDHLHAHLLLAKSYGGTQWLSISYFIHDSKRVRFIPTKIQRRIYSIARSKMKSVYSELPTYSPKTYTFKHYKTGETFRGTKADLLRIKKVSKGSLEVLLRGACKSASGWYLPDRTSPEECGPEGRTLKRTDKTIHRFTHEKGHIFKGTKKDFMERTGCSRRAAERLIRGNLAFVMGYSLHTSPQTRRKPGAGFGRDNGMSRKVLCVTTGAIYDSQSEASRATGVDRAGISACCTGRLKTSGGYEWMFI